MSYTLFNKSNQNKLTHPKVGLWFTNDLEEAKGMLESFSEDLDSSKMSSLKDDIVIFNIDENTIIRNICE